MIKYQGKRGTDPIGPQFALDTSPFADPQTRLCRGEHAGHESTGKIDLALEKQKYKRKVRLTVRKLFGDQAAGGEEKAIEA